MVHEQDKHYFKDLDTNLDKYKNGATFSFYSLWFVSKIRRHEKSLTEYKLIQMSGHYDQKTDLYIATCKQILSVSNREILTGISADCFTSIHDSKLKFQEISLSVENLLGYNLDEDCFETKTLYELLAPESLKLIKERHLQSKQFSLSKHYFFWIRIYVYLKLWYLFWSIAFLCLSFVWEGFKGLFGSGEGHAQEWLLCGLFGQFVQWYERSNHLQISNYWVRILKLITNYPYIIFKNAP